MNFIHQQAAHCESGVMAALLSHHGLPISEPMVFGLANALVFAYIPLIKLAGQPLVSYRLPPKAIIRGLGARLGLDIRFHTFSSPGQAAQALDRALAADTPVGLQTSVFWLPYFPEQMRFHFNAHNLVVYGKDGNDYLISDPIFEEPVRVAPIHLTKARFAKGPLAPKGLMYTVANVPSSLDYASLIPAAIRKNLRIMTQAPLPIIGIRGMHWVSRKIRRLGDKGKPEDIALFLGHLVRMQEEIGTGGAGFRFMYASFLEEAGRLLDAPALLDASLQMTRVGDTWRDFAVQCVAHSRQREGSSLDTVAGALEHCAQQEAALWQQLKAWLAQC